VALIGKPNVGKSSILNKFLDEDKAIVTEIAGTTRDIIEGEVLLNGTLLNIIDTAGIRETTNKIEKMGVEKSKKVLEKADLIIYVLAHNEKLLKSDKEFIDNIPLNKLIIFVNKDDEDKELDVSSLNEEKIVFGNTVSNTGLDELKKKIMEMFNLAELNKGDFTYLSNARQISLVKKALKSIDEALKQNKNDSPVDMIAIDIKSCWDSLGEIIGETYKDELLDELFSKFCLGK
jgi:tRNA modification GTPase